MENTGLEVLATWEKQPGDRQDYDIEFGEWLAELEDTPAAVNPIAVAAPAGITLISSSLIGTAVKLWVSGGVNKTRYKFTVVMTTAQGRVKEAEIVIHVREV